MPFDTQCPECKSNLQLDKTPAKGTPVECPRCGSLFIPPRPKKSDSGDQPRKVKKSKASNEPKKRKIKKKKTNPLILIGAIIFGFGGLIGIGFLMIFMLNRAGKVEEMLSHVPGECNWARGIAVAQLNKYPGYAPEISKFYNESMKKGWDELAKAVGIPDNSLDYLVIAKNRPERGPAGTVYVFRTSKSFKPAGLANLTGASPYSGGDGFKVSTPSLGILTNAVVFAPTSKIFVVVPSGTMQDTMARGVAAAKTDKASSMGGNMNDTSRVVVRGSIWLLVSNKGALKNYTSSLFEPVKTPFKKIADAGSASPTFGLWSTPGGSGVRFGAALECRDSKEAAELVKDMKNGPLGKSDESEAPNELKSALSSVTGDKKLWTAIMQYMTFTSSGNCAYLYTKTANDQPEQSRRMMDIFNAPTIADEGGNQSNFGGFAPVGPGAGGANGGGAPPGRGLPGGIAPPGMAGPGGR